MPTPKRRATVKTAAILTIDKPGAMSPEGRRAIAKWLRDRAVDLIKYGEQFNDTGKFVARYYYK